MPKKRPTVSDGLNVLAEQLVNRVLRPLGLLVISPERIRETLDEAATRGRVTRTDANDLALELIHRARLQTEELLDRARRTVGVGSAFPITGYDALKTPEVKRRLRSLDPDELRKVRDYERRHAKRKSVLAALDAAIR